MTDARPKRAVLAAIGYEPEFSGLALLPRLEKQAGIDLLRWLDWSGLALSFFARLQRHRATGQLSEGWHRALGERLARNRERTEDVLEEAQRLNTAFRSYGVQAATIKGFSLCPDFCDHPSLRHQVDFDFLVAPTSVRAAADALRSSGYSTAHLNESGETCFLTPLHHIPSPHDDIYALQRQRQVDLHISIWEPCSWLPVEVPQDCLGHARPESNHGVEYLGLSLEDKFLLHVLHAFRHSFRSWMRVSWLLEIAYCVEKHRGDPSLWTRVIERAGPARLTKTIFAFVLGLLERLFGSPIPSPLRAWTAEARTLSLRTWLDHFAVDWAMSDWPGSLDNLFLTAEFIPDPKLRMQYWRSRLFPNKTAQVSLGPVAATSAKRFFQLQAARLGYVAYRAALHLKGIAALPGQQMRWRRALGLSRGANFDANW
jgi:Uncharacterised nucleotidyltransferase